jgi:D-sedoheptulose 7-phosphate isomerase
MRIYQQYVFEVRETLDHLPWGSIDAMVQILHAARLGDRQVFVMGNGGSAATASHTACDLGKNTAVPGLPRFRVMSLTDNMPTFSALANDLGYENVFLEQLANFVRRDDVVIAISASGNSPNILRAVEFARACGALTIGWSGFNGGKLAQLVDVAVVIRNNCMEQIEDIHLMLEHMTIVALRALLQKDIERQHYGSNGVTATYASVAS